MAIQHRNITDDQRHEVKGASTASLGQVLQSNGDGTTSFVEPSTLETTGISSTIESFSDSDQNPSAVDTPYQVVFGPNDGNSDVTITSNGNVSITNSGLYFVTSTLSIGTSSVSGDVIIVSRILINGIVYGSHQVVKISDSPDIVPVNFTIFSPLSNGDVITVEIVRDSNGIDDGGLIALAPELGSWDTVPSSFIRVQRITGGA